MLRIKGTNQAEPATFKEILELTAVCLLSDMCRHFIGSSSGTFSEEH